MLSLQLLRLLTNVLPLKRLTPLLSWLWLEVCRQCPSLHSYRGAMDFISFIVTYFVTKDLYMMTGFICWPPEQMSELSRVASGAGVRVAVVTDFRRPPRMAPRGSFREAMLLDVACPDAALILKQASSARALNYGHSWLLVCNSSYERSAIDSTLSEYEILPDADVVWSSPDSLVDLYKVKSDKPFLHTNFGLQRNCSRKELVALWSALPGVVTRRKDLRNVSLKAVSIVTKPEYFRGWSDLRNRQVDTFPKLTYPLMMLAAQDLHFRFNLMQVDLYGECHNGSFDGMVGRLQRHEAEVGLASLFMRPDRMDVMHYFSETYVLSLAFLFRQPSRSAVSNVFLAPFSSGVWVACGGLAAAAVLVLGGLRRVRARTGPAPDLAHLTLRDTCTFALGSLCQQGFHITPAVSSIRVVMFTTMLASLFVFTAYSAKIVAILQTPSQALRTIDDLAHSPMTIGVQDTTYKNVYFLESADQSTQQLYRHKILPQGERAYHGVLDGIARVRRGYFAYQVERNSGYDVITQTFTEREKCSLSEIEAFKVPLVSIPMRRDSGYRELFATRMRWQREVGLMDRARRTWLVARPRCEPGAGGGFLSIAVGDVLPALQALALGALLAFVLLVAELAVHVVRMKTKH